MMIHDGKLFLLLHRSDEIRRSSDVTFIIGHFQIPREEIARDGACFLRAHNETGRQAMFGTGRLKRFFSTM